MRGGAAWCEYHHAFGRIHVGYVAVACTVFRIRHAIVVLSVSNKSRKQLQLICYDLKCKLLVPIENKIIFIDAVCCQRFHWEMDHTQLNSRTERNRIEKFP